MTFYVLYDANTRYPVSVSGTRHPDIPDGLAEGEISDADGEDFVLLRRDMSHYVVNVVDDRVEFLNRRNLAPYKKYCVPNDLVRDLNYNMIFILNFEIKYVYHDHELTLAFDLPALSADRRNTFNTLVNAYNGQCTIYVTESGDPTALLEKFEIDLYQLSKSKTLTQKLDVDQPISVWAIRNRKYPRRKS
jgi:hypothetical protein